MTSSPALQPLTSMEPGARGMVSEIRVPEGARSRLMELGFVQGTPIEVIRFAPLGDPLEVRIRGSLLSLRRHEADQILIDLSG